MTGSNGKQGRDAVILAGARTPQGKFMGALSGMTAAQLGTVAFKAALDRSGIAPTDLNEVLVGNVVSAGVGQALPRQISLGAGVPDTVGGVAINKVCGSGLKAVMLASSAIKAGDGDLFLAGGVESMSRAPYLNDSIRAGNKFGSVTLRDAVQVDGLWCSILDWGMGNAAEFIGRQLEITREEMDAFAYRSHQLAGQATDSGKFKAEITPVTLRGRKGDTIIDADEPIRRDTTLEALAKLAPAFESDGQVTAGNAPGMNDGAAALVVASRDYAEAHGHAPVARVVGYGQAAMDPKWIFYAPVKAIPVALARAGWTAEDVDLFEINEAFAAVGIASMRDLGISDDIVNVNGGAIALGHPIGMSGNRLALTLLHELKRRGGGVGAASLCGGGGQGDALLVRTL